MLIAAAPLMIITALVVIMGHRGRLFDSRKVVTGTGDNQLAPRVVTVPFFVHSEAAPDWWQHLCRLPEFVTVATGKLAMTGMPALDPTTTSQLSRQLRRRYLSGPVGLCTEASDAMACHIAMTANYHNKRTWMTDYRRAA